MHVDCSIRVYLESECSIRVYRSLVAKHGTTHYDGIIYFMLSATYYVQDYGGIICGSLQSIFVTT